MVKESILMTMRRLSREMHGGGYSCQRWIIVLVATLMVVFALFLWRASHVDASGRDPIKLSSAVERRDRLVRSGGGMVMCFMLKSIGERVRMVKRRL